MEGIDDVPPYFDLFSEYKEFCVQYRAKLSQIVRATAGWLPEQVRTLGAGTPHDASPLHQATLNEAQARTFGLLYWLFAAQHLHYFNSPAATLLLNVCRAGSSGRQQAAAGGAGGGVSGPRSRHAAGRASRHGGVFPGSRAQLGHRRAPQQQLLAVPARSARNAVMLYHAGPAEQPQAAYLLGSSLHPATSPHFMCRGACLQGFCEV